MNEDRLAEYLRAQPGGPPDVHSARRLALGRARVLYVVETSAGRFVVQIERGDTFGTSTGHEFRLMQSLHAARFPVPRARWCEPTGDILGQPFFVMDYIDTHHGSGEKMTGAARATAVVQALASLHDLEPTAHLPEVDRAQAIHIQIERWRNIGKSAGAPRVPLLDAAEIWLHRQAPPPAPMALVHGDAGPGSALCADGTLLALTNWEFAHVGDPAEDWSCCMSMRGSALMPRPEWLALFDRVAGVRMSPQDWAYWEAFNLFKAACGTRTCLALFEAGTDRGPDMAIIGTAAHRAFLRRLATLTA